MAEKMYLSEEEAAAKLATTTEQLTNYARDGKLQQYQDGARKVYRASQVEELAAELGQGDAVEIELAAPADTSAGGPSGTASGIESPAPPGKTDTVITSAEGISIFDEEDLDIEVADPMAKTQIAPSLEEQIALEGTGSGSGLLDLTRESDDTSLGAEVLDQIDMDSAVATSLGEETPAEGYAPAEQVLVEVAPLEAIDAAGGLFSGFIVGMTLVTMLSMLAVISAMSERSSALLETLKNQLLIVFAAAVVVVIACGVVGMLLGKSIAARQDAVQKTT